MKNIFALFMIASALLGCGQNETKAPIKPDNEKNLAESILLPETQEEKLFLSDYSCIDEDKCFGYDKFLKFAHQQYPEIKAVKFLATRDMQEDKQTLEMYRRDFYVGLYFSKRIRLANGQTLFDFLTKCSKEISPLNLAQVQVDENRNKFFSMQFFPVLRQKGSGEKIELNILLEKQGEKINATSGWFSSSVLKDSDFMNKHGVQCW